MGVVRAELDIAVTPKIILISGLAPKLCVILDCPLYPPGPQFPQLQQDAAAKKFIQKYVLRTYHTVSRGIYLQKG